MPNFTGLHIVRITSTTLTSLVQDNLKIIDCFHISNIAWVSNNTN